MENSLLKRAYTVLNECDKENWHIREAINLLGKFKENEDEADMYLPNIFNLLAGLKSSKVMVAMKYINDYTKNENAYLLKVGASIDWKLDLIPYTDPPSLDLKFQTNFMDFLTLSGVSEVDQSKASEVVSDVMERVVSVIKSHYPDYEVIVNTSEFPIIWLIVSGIQSYMDGDKVNGDVRGILKDVPKMLTKELKKWKLL